MKPALAILIATATILVIITGSFAMDRMMNAGDHAKNCFLLTLGDQKCIGLNPVQSATTHINALLSISLGIVGAFTVVLIALLLFAWLRVADISKPASTARGYSKVFIEGHAKSIHKQRHWISLLEKRDPSLAFAAST